MFLFSSKCSSRRPKPLTQSQPILGGPEDALALTTRRLAELDRLRELGMEQVERFTAVTRDLKLASVEKYRLMAGGKGTLREFDRVSRAIRRIVALEFELRGLFKSPDRDGIKKQRLGKVRFSECGDLKDYNDLNDLRDINSLNDLKVRLDYGSGPIDALIADIRDTLGAEAPDDDPFAAPPIPELTESDLQDYVSNIMRGRASPLARCPTLPAKPAARAATPIKPAPAKAMRPRNGFRAPPTSPHNPNTPAPNTPATARKHRRNRGPPK